MAFMTSDSKIQPPGTDSRQHWDESIQFCDYLSSTAHRFKDDSDKLQERCSVSKTKLESLKFEKSSIMTDIGTVKSDRDAALQKVKASFSDELVLLTDKLDEVIKSYSSVEKEYKQNSKFYVKSVKAGTSFLSSVSDFKRKKGKHMKIETDGVFPAT